MNNLEVKLSELIPEDIPERFRYDFYFDIDKHPFEHADLIRNAKSVIDVISGIHGYAERWLEEILSQAKKHEKIAKQFFVSQKCEAFQRETSLTPFIGHPNSFGTYRVMSEDSAVFQPANIWGALEERGEHPHTIYVAKGARVLGANIFLNEGDIFIGEGTDVEPDVGIKGPTIIGENNKVRQGAYFRGDVIIGNNCTLRGEIKNSVMMNNCDYPHPSYLGDSVCGYRSHFGNGGTSANFGILNVIEPQVVKVELDEIVYDTERQKVGIVMGDFSQVGCNGVSDPGVFLGPWTLVYALSRLNRGFYGPEQIIKNKPMEFGVIEITDLKR